MGKLILVRHGKSLWNIENIFTGWTDIDLSPEGVEEAKIAGELIKNKGLIIDICFSSFLKRAIRTAWILLDTADMMNVDCVHSWKLNERHYGSWQGKNKDQVLKQVGKERFLKIRKGYVTAPPLLTKDDERHPKFDPKYKNISTSLLPKGESLRDTEKRTVNFFYESIVPHLMQNKTVLVSAHGNSLRALIAHIEKTPNQGIMELTVPTGVPHIYKFDYEMNLLEHHQLT